MTTVLKLKFFQSMNIPLNHSSTKKMIHRHHQEKQKVIIEIL